MITLNTIIRLSIGVAAVLLGCLIFVLFFLPEGTPTALDDVAKQTSTSLPEQSIIEEMEKEVVTRFSGFTKQNAGKFSWEPFIIDGRQAVVQAGLDGIGVDLPEEMDAALNQSDWGMYSCQGDVSDPRFVLRVSFDLSLGTELLTYDQKIRLLQNWESDMLEDVRAILFPSDMFNYQSYKVRSFVDSMITTIPGIRETEVIDGDVPVSTLSYVVIGDMLLISSDTRCMTDVAVSILGLVP